MELLLQFLEYPKAIKWIDFLHDKIAQWCSVIPHAQSVSRSVSTQAEFHK